MMRPELWRIGVAATAHGAYDGRVALSRWGLTIDLAFANVLVWLARFGREGELTREAHLYFFDRYSRLASYHRGRGHAAKAARFDAKAESHHVDEFDSGPPFGRQWRCRGRGGSCRRMRSAGVASDHRLTRRSAYFQM